MVDEAKDFIKILTISSRTEEIRGVLRELKAYFGEKNYLGIKYQRLLGAIYEALTNAVIHGNRSDETKKILITYLDCVDKFEVKIIDEGKGFDIESIPDPRLPENVIKPNGRGLYLIKNSVDELCFGEKGNEITMGINK